ncbi:MAG: serine/threonine-protein kinase [Planctomycetota bacterium]
MSVSYDQFAQKLSSVGLMTLDELQEFERTQLSSDTPTDVDGLAKQLVRRYKLTEYQAEVIRETRRDPLIVGDYFIMDKIGEGGMGIVYKARPRNSYQLVALKMMAPRASADLLSIKRFQREVELASLLKHPNIVTALDSGEHEGHNFLVMELVDGLHLGAVLHTRKTLAVLTAFDHVLDAARGLAFAHSKNVIHRDIKPSNLLVDRSGSAKILDMGLARVISPDAATDSDVTLTEITRAGALMGTADFIAPEQALNAKNADRRADIYSLGCTMYFAFTGKNIYPGETSMEKIVAHREQPIPSLRSTREEVAPEVDRIFQKMVAKSVDDRYQTMVEVIMDMEKCRKEFGHMWMIQRFIAEKKLPSSMSD